MKNLPAFIFAYIWSTLIEVCCFLVIPLLSVAGIASKWNVRERSRIPSLRMEPSGKDTIWMHAASLGEARLLAKFVKIIAKKHPDDLFLLTAVTSSGAEFLATIDSNNIVATGFFPFDTMRLMKKVICCFSVKRLWIMETEIWPSMLVSCMEKKIPVGIINGRMEKGSFAWYNRLGIICRPLFKNIDIVLAQDEEYACRFIKMGVKQESVHVAGNVKSIREFAIVPEEKRIALRRKLNIGERDFVLTVGCLHREESGEISAAIEHLVNRNISVKFIIVPRYVDEAGTIASAFSKDAILIGDTSTGEEWEACVIAKFGVLDDMYALADAAFIGGTFNNTGGHNVWEAASCCIPVIFGPDYRTQRESCAMLMNSGAAFMASSGVVLADIIEKMINTDRSVFVSAFSEYMDSSRKRIELIERFLP
jgi:3-deoxy-D-manno-octulosonic-acid transferase